MTESVGIIGAGLVGCLAALAFAKRGYRVTLFDYRADPRDEATTDRNLRSINLAISSRGISSLEFVDDEVAKRALRDIIPMKGRMIHDSSGRQESQIYGLFGEAINSIDRGLLNNNLLDELDKYDGTNDINLMFDHKLVKIDFGEKQQECLFATTNYGMKTYDFDFVVGCDGAYSATRYQMQKQVRLNYAQEYIDCCYIELYIPPSPEYNSEFNGPFAIAPDHLHIWPRDEFMLIALPNADGSFTSTFFGSWALVESLVPSKNKVEEFLLANFPDAMELMGIENAVRSFMDHPKGALMCVECNPYHASGGRAIILGDAAHSMVPFYGQGMNCGFEDVKVLMKLLDKNKNRTEVFEQYSKQRHEDLVAIVTLAKNNYKEMSHDVTSKMFLMRKKLDGVLGKVLKGKWLPLYTMVSFRDDIAYHKAIEISRKQTAILKLLQAIIIVAISASGYKAFGYFSRLFKRLSALQKHST
ncbi:hypothetical protein HG535_0E04210 [Zygotorulaspora mrakii]|uniref:Kynurenine 3-monooxygenase n=1 Tax=Zygotorulaspora mrakii TaxID=42260 RepID=A0A7H9B469_ZYGMR|nr:uncharacterized protein HG535_0E04210 [Zygotorulaspora mrakii]QLG73337.1 hypothetical protein HG535_0E04210 [Zygotorulaspora mrakii]